MSAYPVTYFQAQCDRCGKIEDDYGDYSAMADAEQAIDLALDMDCWEQVGDRLLCEDCWTWSDDESEMVEKPPVAPS